MVSCKMCGHIFEGYRNGDPEEVDDIRDIECKCGYTAYYCAVPMMPPEMKGDTDDKQAVHSI